jgi:hypothetical protein
VREPQGRPKKQSAIVVQGLIVQASKIGVLGFKIPKQPKRGFKAGSVELVVARNEQNKRSFVSGAELGYRLLQISKVAKVTSNDQNVYVVWMHLHKKGIASVSMKLKMKIR